MTSNQLKDEKLSKNVNPWRFKTYNRFHDDLLVDSQLNSHPNGGCQEKGPMNNEGLADKGL